jgi:hypothetical protein
MYVPLWLRKWPIIFVRKKNLAIKPGSELLWCDFIKIDKSNAFYIDKDIVKIHLP